MRVLLTGATGFLAGRLARHLSNRHQLVLATRQAAHSAAAAERVVQVDWNSRASLGDACRGVDTVIHLAALNAAQSAADPAAADRVNHQHTANLARIAQQSGVRRFIYFSTAHVYGQLIGNVNESTPTQGAHPYAVTHQRAESAVLAIDGLESVVVRLSNAFGEPATAAADCWTLFINDLCRSAATTGVMLVRSSGVARRDFIPLHEVCRATQHLLELPASALNDGLFNVGARWAPRLIDAAMLVQQRAQTLLQRPIRLECNQQSGEDSPEFDYSIDKLINTGFTPAADPAAEIDQLLAFCARNFPHD